MRIIGRIAFTLLASGLAASFVACEKSPVGTLEIHWAVNGDVSAGACAAAEVTHVRVLVDNTRAETDDDPLQPTWHYADFACDAEVGRLDLTEGIYRVRVVALRDGVEVRSQAVDLLDVEVIDGETTSIPRNPDLEPPISIEVAVCGDGVIQAGEWCDASDLGGNDCESLGNSGGELFCNDDCTFDTSGCWLEQSALTIDWTLYESNATTSATCAGLGVATVEVTVAVAGVGTLVHTQTADCTALQAVVPDLGYGLYTVHLSGRDAGDAEVATGSSGVTDHTDPGGTDVAVDLIGL
jgi:hypothetical protein